MSTASQQYALANNGSFQQRVIAATVSYAVNTVAGELGTVNDHVNRLALAQQVVIFPDGWARRFALACVFSNANLQSVAPSDANAVDADISAAVTTVWNGLSDALAALQTAKVI